MRALCRCTLLLIFLMHSPRGFSQPRPLETASLESASSDSPALQHLFDESVLVQNAVAICRRGDQLSPDERYQFLLKWVLPSNRQASIRLYGGYYPSSPAPILGRSRTGSVPDENLSPLMRYVAGAETLAFPAYELIQVAQQTGRLNHLRQQIVDVSPLDADQACSRMVLLFLVDMALGDSSATSAAFEQLAQQLRLSDRGNLSARWRDLLVMWSVLSHSEPREMVGDYVFSFYGDIGKYYPDQRFDVMMDYLRATQGLSGFLKQQTEQSNVVIDAMHQGTDWLPYSFSSAFERGHGRPRAVWAIEPDRIRKIVGHEMDYLSYRTPLRGDFEVECEMTTGSSLNAALMVAGTHIEYIEHIKSVRIGNFRKKFEDIPIRPPLNWNNQPVRHRAVVRSGILTHYINGRVVLQKELPVQFDPWISIRSWRRSHGGFNNLRINGQPQIPEQIDLIGSPDADGWAPYYEERFGIQGATWEVIQEPAGTFVIHGNTRDAVSSKTIQSLLRYHRPIEEDGTIDYEFFYDAGKSCVHPAIDRLAFVLDPEGVRIHWITDGVHDRSDLHPRNETIEAENRRGPDRLPLIEKDWNRMRLAFEGDQLQMSLNGQLIYERKLEPENRRTFGFFFYCDQTEAYARNAIWRGNWPKALPLAIPPQ